MSGNSKQQYENLPEGDYLVAMDKVEEKSTKNGAGKMVACGFRVKTGEFKDRLVFERFLVEHSNPKAAEIGTDRLNKYLKAIGLENGLEDISYDRSRLEEYTGTPFIASVGIEEGSNGYGDRNVIKSFKRR